MMMGIESVLSCLANVPPRRERYSMKSADLRDDAKTPGAVPRFQAGRTKLVSGNASSKRQVDGGQHSASLQTW